MPHELQIVHRTEYSYSEPVTLEPHVIRLSPRADYNVRVVSETMAIQPEPVGISRAFDEFENRTTRVWFAEATERLSIESRLVVQLREYNPFAVLITPPEAGRLPLQYDADLTWTLAAARTPSNNEPAVQNLATDLARGAGHETLPFLSQTAATLHRDFTYHVRPDGAPYSAGETIRLGAGSCRDLTVLFVELCRAQGIALTGQHVPVAAAALPANAAPVSGSFRGVARTEMKTQITFA